MHSCSAFLNVADRMSRKTGWHVQYQLATPPVRILIMLSSSRVDVTVFPFCRRRQTAPYKQVFPPCKHHSIYIFHVINSGRSLGATFYDASIKCITRTILHVRVKNAFPARASFQLRRELVGPVSGTCAGLGIISAAPHARNLSRVRGGSHTRVR